MVESVLLSRNNIERMDMRSTIQIPIKDSSSKSSLTFPLLVRFYKKCMGDVDLIHSKTAACLLDCRPKCRFYLQFFFHLMDMDLVVNCH